MPHERLPVKPARPGRKYSLRRTAGGSRSRRPTARIARSGLPSPAAMESPMPAISTSRTWISVATRWVLPSRSRMSTAASVGLSEGDPQLHFLDAVGLHRTGRAVAVVEAPDAGLERRQHAFERDADPMIARVEIRLRAGRRARRPRSAVRHGRCTAVPPCRAPSRGHRSHAPGVVRWQGCCRRARRCGGGNRLRCGTGETGSSLPIRCAGRPARRWPSVPSSAPAARR